MALITPFTTVRGGTDVSSTAQAASGGGDKFNNLGQQLLYIENTGGADITLTIVIQSTIDGQAPSNRTVTVPHTVAAHLIIGPFPTGVYNDGNGQVNLTYSAVSGVKVNVFTPGN